MKGDSSVIIQTVTFGIAVLGAVLGILNTWHNLDKMRLKLKVVPAHAMPVGGVDPRLRFCISVTNLSAFPVTIDEVGVRYHRSMSRGALISPATMDEGRWPRRLESRSSVTVYSQLPDSSDGLRIRCAYARTECGHTKEGTSPALRQIASGHWQ